MNMDRTDLELIQQTVQYYFDGLYHSDIEKLNKAFHPNAQITIGGILIVQCQTHPNAPPHECGNFCPQNAQHGDYRAKGTQGHAARKEITLQGTV